MKVALINNLYAPVARGGAERIVELQAELLRQAGHQVVIITTKPWGAKLVKNDDGILRVGGLAGSFYHLQKIPKPLRLVWHLLSWCDLVTPWFVSLKLVYSGCQVVVGHNLTGLSLWLPRFITSYGIPYIQVLHDVQYLHPSGLMFKGGEGLVRSVGARIYQLITRSNFKVAKTVISPSNWLAELFIDLKMTAPAKLAVLANPVQKSLIFVRQPSQPFSFIFVGQLEPHKGIIELLTAFGELKGDFQLKIAGDGSLARQVDNLAQNDPRIKVLGRLNQEELLQAMAGSSMLVLPSTCYENFPTVILEAFAQKLPVMGSDWGGIQELLADGAGLTFNPLDRQDFVSTLQKAVGLSTADLEKYTDHAYAKVAHFETEAYAEKFLNLLQK